MCIVISTLFERENYIGELLGQWEFLVTIARIERWMMEFFKRKKNSSMLP